MVAIIIVFMLEDTSYYIAGANGLTTKSKRSNIQLEEESDELWLKWVKHVSVCYTNDSLLSSSNSSKVNSHIFGMKLWYEDTLNGSLKGSCETTNTVYQSMLDHHTFSVGSADDHVTNIALWFNQDDTIAAMQFTTAAGTFSPRYGYVNNQTASHTNLHYKLSGDTFAWAGATVTTGTYDQSSSNDDNIHVVTAIKVAWMNERTGQYGSLDSQRFSMLFTGIWWFGFSLVVFRYLRDRRGPPLPKELSYRDAHRPDEQSSSTIAQMFKNPRLNDGVLADSVPFDQRLTPELRSDIHATSPLDSVRSPNANANANANANTNANTSMVSPSDNKSNDTKTHSAVEMVTLQDDLHFMKMQEAMKGKEHTIKVNVFTYSIIKFYVSLREGHQFPHLFRYLCTYFLWSDGLNTIASCGILFAQQVLLMTSLELVVLLAEVQLSAILGAFVFLWIQKKMDYPTKKMLLIHIAILGVIPLYAMIGMIKGATFGKLFFFLFLFYFYFCFVLLKKYKQTNKQINNKKDS
ncbi:hypothetical protein RFI_13930 [Reticulomyxa filosa]|uniref:Uncharacterized protein n=1 Tax=Reticulomyxa filosa TaxID=46433 RepID=X6NAC7_RETFI|nr:hypothetical protein RFI_13930 [Reticulomyxa filosa]|eukprot:ETO23250.1 hypothetical protein RFI_13930 [Reticulomyxa filosa]